LTSLLHPELAFAQTQARTVSGCHIRDLITYNDAKDGFLAELRALYAARQVVFELKNVAKLEAEHVNQLYRYLDEVTGRVGVIVCREPPPQSVMRNMVDLHSSKRVVILTLADSDIGLMTRLLGTSRRPLDVLKKRYIEFTRLLPK